MLATAPASAISGSDGIPIHTGAEADKVRDSFGMVGYCMEIGQTEIRCRYGASAAGCKEGKFDVW